jgi:hypothetical protein
MGAIHPVIFFTLVYAIAIFLAFFVCRTVYYSLNEDSSSKTVVTYTASAESVASVK